MVSQATNCISNTLGATNMALVGGFKKVKSPSVRFPEQMVYNKQGDMQNSSMSEPDINAHSEQAQSEIDRLGTQCEAKLEMTEFITRLQRQKIQFSQHYQNRETHLQLRLQAHLQTKHFCMKTNYQAQQA